MGMVNLETELGNKINLETRLLIKKHYYIVGNFTVNLETKTVSNLKIIQVHSYVFKFVLMFLS